ncbi:MAG: hypothetical protein QXQ46_05295, partial [Thermoplasmatales archaeon]
QFCDIRGNIDTRIDKWKKGEVNSLVIAKVALDRLGISVPGAPIPINICPPDPNQGFIAVVSRKKSRTSETLSLIQEAQAEWEAKTEREIMEKLDLGCDQAVSVFADFNLKKIKFSYANEKNRFDLSFAGKIGNGDILKMRDIIGR